MVEFFFFNLGKEIPESRELKRNGSELKKKSP